MIHKEADSDYGRIVSGSSGDHSVPERSDEARDWARKAFGLHWKVLADGEAAPAPRSLEKSKKIAHNREGLRRCYAARAADVKSVRIK